MRWLVILLTLLALDARAQDNYVGLTTISRHFNTDRQYNEEHWGLFFERHTSRSWGYQLGYYKNSFDRSTWYATGIWQPVHVGPVDLGGFVGLATGYEEGRLVPLIGMTLTIRFTDKFSTGFVGGTAVVANQIKWRLK